MLGIYCRISQQKSDGKDRSINDQKLLGLELAEQLNLNTEIFIEEGISGTLPVHKRPELERLLQKIEDGIITHMFIYMQDRLERNTEVRFYIKRILKDANAHLFTESGEVDLFDEDADLLGDIQSLFNAKSVRDTKKRVKSVLKRNAEEGRPHGVTPYGYKVENGKYILDEFEAEIVKIIYNYSLNGISTSKIANTLNNENIKTKQGKIWLASSIYYLLKNPRYKGERPCKSVENGHVPIELIVDSLLWEKVQLSLKANKRYSGAPQTHNYLLKNILKCNCCGLNYHGVVSKKNNHYSCISNTKTHLKDTCNNSGINITKLDRLIWERFFIDKKIIQLVKNHIKEDKIDNNLEFLNSKLTKLELQLNENNKEFKNIRTLAVQGLYSTDELKPEISKNKKIKIQIEIEISNIKEEIFALEKSIIKPNDITKELNNIKAEIPFNKKKEIVHKYIKEIRINNEFKQLRVHEIEIYFNIPNLKSEVYLVPYKMHYAVEIFDEILIPISDKFKKVSKKELKQIGIATSRAIKATLKKDNSNSQTK
jgi:DNA invertase Pin-like site-specific DNA recombinase